MHALVTVERLDFPLAAFCLLGILSRAHLVSEARQVLFEQLANLDKSLSADCERFTRACAALPLHPSSDSATDIQSTCVIRTETRRDRGFKQHLVDLQLRRARRDRFKQRVQIDFAGIGGIRCKLGAYAESGQVALLAVLTAEPHNSEPG